MSDIEKEPKTLADELAALQADNGQADGVQTEDESVVIDASAMGEVLGDAQLGLGEEETDEDRISEMTAALQRLASEGKLEEGELSFIDGPADMSDVDSSVADELIAASLSETSEELPENPMIVGEAEQLPMLGLDAASTEEAEEEAEEEVLEFVDNDKLISVLESLLFATDKPVSIATMKVLFKGTNIKTRDIQRGLDVLASGYASADRGVSLEEIHGGYQLRTKVDNTEFLKKLAKVRPFRLSGPALEVMAITAYKQPITKTEVDQIRGVESGHLMRALMERGLVGFGEKSDLPGRPMTYVTTRKFLETFGLRNLKELPTLAEIDQLLPEGIGAEEEKETLSDVTDSMSQAIGSAYSEGEDELQDISESLKVIDTTSEFFEQEKVRQRVERDQQKAQDIRDRITFGDEVEDKDRKWLARYEAKQEQIAQAAQAGESAGPLVVDEEGETPSESTVAAASDVSADEEPGVAGDLAALSEESEDLRMEASASDSDEEELEDELASNPEFDEDAASADPVIDSDGTPEREV